MNPFRSSKMRMPKLADGNFDRVIKLKHAAMSVLRSSSIEIEFPFSKRIQIPIPAGELVLVFSLPKSELTEFINSRGEAPSLEISIREQDGREVLRVTKQTAPRVYEPGLWEDALLARAAHAAESVQTPDEILVTISDFADTDLLARLYGAALALLRNEAGITCRI